MGCVGGKRPVPNQSSSSNLNSISQEAPKEKRMLVYYLSSSHVELNKFIFMSGEITTVGQLRQQIRSMLISKGEIAKDGDIVIKTVTGFQMTDADNFMRVCGESSVKVYEKVSKYPLLTAVPSSDEKVAKQGDQYVKNKQ